MADRALGFAAPTSAAKPSGFTDPSGELGRFAETRQALRDSTAHGMRWAVEGEPLPVGRVLAAPGDLGSCLAGGQISLLLTEAQGIVAWPGDDAPADWAQQLQQLLNASLSAASQWEIQTDPAAVLAFLAADVIAGELAELIASHGGQIQVVRADDASVDVSLGGHCRDCPLADLTLHARLRGALSRRMGCPIQINDVTVRKPQRNWLPLSRRA